jgi:ketosteroid isomerase-like protein
VSRENVEIVRRGYAAFERGDFEAMLDGVGPDHVTYRAEPDSATWHGPEGLLEAIADWTAGFDEFSSSTDEFVDAGDRVIARMRQRARGKASGVSVEADFWCVHTLEDGKQIRYEIYSSREQALEAAGKRSRPCAKGWRRPSGLRRAPSCR